MPRFYFNWKMDNHTGWGIIATNLAFWALEAGFEPVALSEQSHKLEDFPAYYQNAVHYADRLGAEYRRKMAMGWRDDDPHSRALLGMTNEGMTKSDNIPEINLLGRSRNFGIFVTESGTVDGQTPNIPMLRQSYRKMVAGSNWNRDILIKFGMPVDETITIMQGVNDKIFFPSPQRRKRGDNFYIFSGGKIEVRKSQDLILSAFARILQTIPNAILVTAWHWVGEDTSENNFRVIPVAEHPFIYDQRKKQIKIAETAAQYGIPPDHIIDLPMMSNIQLGEVLRSVDCSIFVSRCEGGTNIMAMETIASGVPTILSDCCGHKDLLDWIPTLRQWAVPAPYMNIVVTNRMTGELDKRFMDYVDGWGWPDYAKIVDHVLSIYHNYEQALDDASVAALTMKQNNWQNFFNSLLHEMYRS